MSKLRPIALYRKFWRIADSILQERKPCKFETDSEGRVTCWSNRERNAAELQRREERRGYHQSLMPFSPVFDGCCGDCAKLDPRSGCTVDNLECKMWTCAEMRDHGDQVTVVALKTLRQTARKIGLPSYGWCSAKDAFKQTGLREFPQYAFRHVNS